MIKIYAQDVDPSVIRRAHNSPSFVEKEHKMGFKLHEAGMYFAQDENGAWWPAELSSFDQKTGGYDAIITDGTFERKHWHNIDPSILKKRSAVSALMETEKHTLIMHNPDVYEALDDQKVWWPCEVQF